MSSSPAPRRHKAPAEETRSPMFEVRHDPLPTPPTPLQKSRDPFDDVPEGRPRTALRPPRAGQQPAPPRPLERELPELTPAPDGPIAAALEKRQREQSFVERAYQPRQVYHMPIPPASPQELVQRYPWLLLVAGGICIAIIWLLTRSAPPTISFWSGGRQIGLGAIPSLNRSAPPAPPGEHSVLGQPTITADMVDKILTKYNSPAAGTGRAWIDIGEQYGIDPAYALAFFIHESTAGTNPGWAGMKPGGGSTHNIGNIICAGYATCYGGFRDYSSWEAGVDDWYKLIAQEYITGRGLVTVEGILPVYCPVNDGCRSSDYVAIVNKMVEQWRQGILE